MGDGRTIFASRNCYNKLILLENNGILTEMGSLVIIICRRKGTLIAYGTEIKKHYFGDSRKSEFN